MRDILFCFVRYGFVSFVCIFLLILLNPKDKG